MNEKHKSEHTGIGDPFVRPRDFSQTDWTDRLKLSVQHFLDKKVQDPHGLGFFTSVTHKSVSKSFAQGIISSIYQNHNFAEAFALITPDIQPTWYRHPTTFLLLSCCFSQDSMANSYYTSCTSNMLLVIALALYRFQCPLMVFSLLW